SAGWPAQSAVKARYDWSPTGNWPSSSSVLHVHLMTWGNSQERIQGLASQSSLNAPGRLAWFHELGTAGPDLGARGRAARRAAERGPGADRREGGAAGRLVRDRRAADRGGVVRQAVGDPADGRRRRGVEASGPGALGAVLRPGAQPARRAARAGRGLHRAGGGRVRLGDAQPQERQPVYG